MQKGSERESFSFQVSIFFVLGTGRAETCALFPLPHTCSQEIRAVRINEFSSDTSTILLLKTLLHTSADPRGKQPPNIYTGGLFSIYNFLYIMKLGPILKYIL